MPLINEPEDLYPIEYHFELNSFPYSFLSNLAVHLFYEEGWKTTPVKKSEVTKENSFWEKFYPEWEGSHLINHSDSEDYYLPIQFTKVINAYGKYKVLAPPLGSSFKLLDELKELVPIR